jgi:hypothetical protein
MKHPHQGYQGQAYQRRRVGGFDVLDQRNTQSLNLGAAGTVVRLLKLHGGLPRLDRGGLIAPEAPAEPEEPAEPGDE